MRQIMYFALFSVTLAACAQNEPRVIERPVVQTRVVTPDITIQNRPRPVNMRDVDFFVVTEENFDEFKERFLAENNEFVFVAVSIQDYEDLSLNLADLRRFINQQREIIVFYEQAVS